MVKSTDIYADGLAIALFDITDEMLTFAFQEERISLRFANVSDKRPNEVIQIFDHHGLRVARIEDVRKAHRLYG